MRLDDDSDEEHSPYAGNEGKRAIFFHMDFFACQSAWYSKPALFFGCFKMDLYF